MRPILSPAALDLNVLGDDVSTAGGMGRDGGALRLEPETGAPLPVSRDAEVGDEAGRLGIGHQRRLGLGGSGVSTPNERLTVRDKKNDPTPEVLSLVA